jgi:hypothetical protein
MHKNRMFIAIVALILASLACTLPGTASPTPFVFPTPNLTLTAIFQPTTTPARATEEPTELVAVVTASASPEGTEPTSTATPVETPRPDDTEVTAFQFELSPTIDGDLSEWPVDRWNATEVVYGRSNWTGGSDLSSSFILGWDSSNLYVGIQVNDDSHVQIAAGRSLYLGDSAEILLDAQLESDLNTDRLSADDYQVGLSPGDLNTRQPETYRWFPRSVEGSLSSPSVAAEPTSDGYVLEASIPWIVFGIEPEAGDTFGFALSISDNDLSGTRVQQSMVSSSSTRSLTDPTTWGILVLASSSN